jgi:5'-nucleotidase
MRILVSNDDGISAPGIKALAEKLSLNPKYQVYVCAPDRERSATGHSLTLHKPLRVEEFDLGEKVKGAWSTTGTPSDCVKFAITTLLDAPPDLVVSGINTGPNLGTDVLYSGTVSAAMEGAMLGIPSIALSIYPHSAKRYDLAAEFASRLSEVMHDAKLPKHTMLNVNVPSGDKTVIKGVAITELGIRLYHDVFEKRVDPRGGVYYWLAGQAIETDDGDHIDSSAVLKDYISVTPIHFNLTDKPSVKLLSGWDALQKLPEALEKITT